ncbi:hypothetical protein ABBQ32_003427 [Trebouxia sp. C0010 RCD-2024]
MSVPVESGEELDDHFTGLADVNGLISVAGFGSLLSRTSAASTFPDLQNFRSGKVKGYRRIFAHTASVFFQRGIARSETGEISSLSCEPCHGEELIVSVFEIPGSADAVQVWTRSSSGDTYSYWPLSCLVAIPVCMW